MLEFCWCEGEEGKRDTFIRDMVGNEIILTTMKNVFQSDNFLNNIATVYIEISPISPPGPLSLEKILIFYPVHAQRICDHYCIGEKFFH
jgi:hypothetical protein